MAVGASETFLGLDIGTSSVKALLIDAEQRTVADVSVPLSLSRPQPLWSEQNADDWVDAVSAGVAALRKSAPEAFARRGIHVCPQTWHGKTGSLGSSGIVSLCLRLIVTSVKKYFTNRY